MSEQAPVVDQEGSQGADTQERAVLQRAISEIALKEQQLTAQREQLRQRIAQYEQQAWIDRGSDREGMARQARDYSQRLQSHLPLIQQQLETLRIQREQLAQHLALVESQPPLIMPGEQGSADAGEGAAPLSPIRIKLRQDERRRRVG